MMYNGKLANNLLSNYQLSGFTAGGVKSVQHGEAAITAYMDADDIAITAVSTTASIGLVVNNEIVGYRQCTGSLTSGTNLRTTIAVAGAIEITYDYQVVEFEGVKSLQHIEAEATNATLDITIDAVNLSKTRLFFQSRSLINNIVANMVRSTLSATTNIHVYNSGIAAYGGTAQYVADVVEFS